MASDYKSVPEWSEVFRIAQSKTYEDLQPASEETILAELAFVASAQDLKMPGRKKSPKDFLNDPIILSSPFLTEQDIQMRSNWDKARDTLPRGLLAHVEKLGDAMNDITSCKDDQQKEELTRYRDVAEDVSKTKAWHDKTEARIGDPVFIFGREFASLWAALDFSIHQQEEALALEILILSKLAQEAADREDELAMKLKE